MPVDLTCKTSEVIDLDEYIDFIRSSVDLRDIDSVAESAPKLKALQNNRYFLAKALAGQIEAMLDGAAAWRRQGYHPDYAANVFVLYNQVEFFVRANFWSPATAVSEGAKQLFAFEVAHDHNFDFMTVGYAGPGYETDLFEYDIEEVVGYPGEPVDLVHLGRTQLSEGRILLFRKGRDIHTQLPPAQTSISLNLMIRTKGQPAAQFLFDPVRGRIDQEIDLNGRLLLLEFAGILGDPSSLELCAELSRVHQCPRTRLAAYRALERPNGPGAWETALQDESPLVRHHAQDALRK